MDGDAQVSGKVVLNEVSCAVGRPIVDNQDFETRVPVFDDGTQRAVISVASL